MEIRIREWGMKWELPLMTHTCPMEEKKSSRKCTRWIIMSYAMQIVFGVWLYWCYPLHIRSSAKWVKLLRLRSSSGGGAQQHERELNMSWSRLRGKCQPLAEKFHQRFSVSVGCGLWYNQHSGETHNRHTHVIRRVKDIFKYQIKLYLHIIRNWSAFIMTTISTDWRYLSSMSHHLIIRI